MTTPFPFVSGAVLTAAQMNAITTLPINDQTASYTLVVGDAGKRVVMDVASENTVTVNNSIFAVGDTIFIANIGAGATTVTEGAGVTINSASGLNLETNQSGQLIALSASSFLYVATATPVGLTFITGATFTAATSFSLPNDTFTTTYDNYKIFISLTTSTDADFTMRLRAAGSDTTGAIYNTCLAGVTSGGSAGTSTGNSATSFAMGEQDAGIAGYSAILDVVNPKLATNTRMHGSINFIDKAATASVSRVGTFWINNTTAYDSLSFISSVASSITGNYKVFGYTNS